MPYQLIAMRGFTIRTDYDLSQNIIKAQFLNSTSQQLYRATDIQILKNDRNFKDSALIQEIVALLGGANDIELEFSFEQGFLQANNTQTAIKCTVTKVDNVAELGMRVTHNATGGVSVGFI